MIGNRVTLPEDYRILRHIDLQKDKKLFFLINGSSFLILILAVGIGNQLIPFRTFYSMEKGIVLHFIRLIVTMGGIVLYFILHELVHGIFIKHYSGLPPKYGFKLSFAYAGSSAYFNKQSYLVITLAPLVIWGIFLTVTLIFVPVYWFWTVYILQICNASGAAGDLYMTWLITSLPEDILVLDSGISMMIYAPEQKPSKGDINNEH